MAISTSDWMSALPIKTAAYENPRREESNNPLTSVVSKIRLKIVPIRPFGGAIYVSIQANGFPFRSWL